MTIHGRTSDMLESQYRRLLLWYPARWRRTNGAAALGMLLDDADHRGVKSISAAEKLAIIRSACHERFLSFERVPMLNQIVLLFGVVFSAVYSFGVAWAPGIRVSGSLGPFANPSVVVGGLLASAWIAAVANAGRSSRVLAWAALGVDVLIAVGASHWHWFGPSLWVASAFALTALAGGVRIGRHHPHTDRHITSQ